MLLGLWFFCIAAKCVFHLYKCVLSLKINTLVPVTRLYFAEFWCISDTPDIEISFIIKQETKKLSKQLGTSQTYRYKYIKYV